MKIISTQIENFGPHEQVVIRWDRNAPLVALVGSNGAGKTFIMESVMAALYGDFPSYRGNIYAALKADSNGQGLIVVEFIMDGKKYRVTRTVKKSATGKTQSNTAVLESFVDGKTELIAGGKASLFNAKISELVGSRELAEATWFSAYRSARDLCEILPSARADVIGEFIETADLGDVSERAKQQKMREKAKAESALSLINDSGKDAKLEYGSIEAALDHYRSEEQNTQDVMDGLSVALLNHSEAIMKATDELSKLGDKISEAAAIAEARAKLVSLAQNQDRIQTGITEAQNTVALEDEIKATIGLIEQDKNVLAHNDRLKWRDDSDAAQVNKIEMLVQSLISGPEKTREMIADARARLILFRESDEFAGEKQAPDELLIETRERVNTLGVQKAKLAEIEKLKKSIASNSELLTHHQSEIDKIREVSEREGPDANGLSIIQNRLTKEIGEASEKRRKAESILTQTQKDINNINTKIRELSNLDELNSQRQKSILKSNERQSDFSLIEKAFGRSGIQALLVEKAIKPFENIASEMLREATDGAMDLRILTLKENKDGSTKEEISILVTDHHGERDVYQYSGGERRLISTIIRLALSRWIAERSGRRYGTVCIDEAYDSLDPIRKAKLTEMLSNIVHDFDQIVVVTPDATSASGVQSHITL